MKDRINIIMYSLCLIASIVSLIIRYLVISQPNDFVKDITSGLAFSGATFGIGGFWQLLSNYGWKSIKCKILYPNAKVYVSLSYLLNIKLSGEDKYLLIKGGKINQYQPVGGVYKNLSKNIDKDWEAESRTDRGNPLDLRFFTKAKYIPEIKEWFVSGKEREFGVWREFQEELIESEILKSESFKHIDVEFLRTEEKMMSKENRFKDEKYHTVLYDIFKVILTSEQEKEIKQLYEGHSFSDKYAFVEADEIHKECFNNSHTKIGQHTKLILNYK